MNYSFPKEIPFGIDEGSDCSSLVSSVLSKGLRLLNLAQIPTVPKKHCYGTQPGEWLPVAVVFSF
jgi:hypothetical protein